MQKVISITLVLAGLILIGACQSESENSGEVEGMTQQEQAPQQAPQQQPQMEQPPGAQIELSDEDLAAFAQIDSELRLMQENAREQMIGVIEEHGMTLEEYQQHSQMQQQGMTDQISEEAMGSMGAINDQMGEIQESMQETMESKVEQLGMTVEEYQDMAMAINQNPEYQQRVTELQN